MEWKDHLQANGWADQGKCQTCSGIKWTWKKGDYLIVVIGDHHTMFKMTQRGKILGTFKIFQLEEKTRDL